MGVYIEAVVQAKKDGVWSTVDPDYSILRGLKIYWWLGFEANEDWKTDEQMTIVPIALPRGYPVDYTPSPFTDPGDTEPRIEMNCARYDCSWLTAQEILHAPLPPAEERGSDVPPSPVPRWLEQCQADIDLGERPSACNIAAIRADLQRWVDEHGEVRVIFGFW